MTNAILVLTDQIPGSLFLTPFRYLAHVQYFLFLLARFFVLFGSRMFY